MKKMLWGFALLCVLACPLTLFAAAGKDPGSEIVGGDMKKHSYPMPPLSPREADVLLRKATEAPYSGPYVNNRQEGVYVCRQCGAPLYTSSDKFDSGCGWPAFDAEIPGAVRRTPDADGRRTEIVCSECGGHLGHVFEGEGFTPTNTRHCVNSLSMKFYPQGSPEAEGARARSHADKAQTGRIVSGPQNLCTGVAIVAGGCFWGVEDGIRKLEGVCDVVSGYTGGRVANPTYEQVCSGNTGHAEAVHIRFDPAKIGYEQILRRFFEIHDPTQVNRQGPDFGEQYRSAVFYVDAEQKAVAEKLAAELKNLGYAVVTQIVPAGPFYEAEAYHQRFAERTGRGGCHLPVPRFSRRADGAPVR